MLDTLTPSQILTHYGLMPVTTHPVQQDTTSVVKSMRNPFTVILNNYTPLAEKAGIILKTAITLMSDSAIEALTIVHDISEISHKTAFWSMSQIYHLSRSILTACFTICQLAITLAFPYIKTGLIESITLIFIGLCFMAAVSAGQFLNLVEITYIIIRHIYKYIRFQLQPLMLSNPVTKGLIRSQTYLNNYQNKPRLLPHISLTLRQKIGMSLIIMALAGGVRAAFPFLGLEFNYALAWAKQAYVGKVAEHALIPLPTPSPQANPLLDSNGKEVIPANTDFALIIPLIGINAPVIAGVNPGNVAGYEEALKKGVAHASTSFYPNENGTVYLFSHSTNYEWFVKDLNAVFYLLKNIKEGDYVVIMYLGNRYTYRIRETRVVENKEVAYLSPQAGKRNLILQTCWPPGTAWKRLLIFADLVDEQANTGFGSLVQVRY